MDPELLQLLIQATGGRSGAGRTSSNLEDVLLGYLSGGYNPMTDMDSGSTSGKLIQKYGSSQLPAFQAIMDNLLSGADQYELDSIVSRLEANQMIPETGFTTDSFRSLVDAMYKEYTGGGSAGKKDVWQKAGLSNPLDVYDIQTAPLGKKGSAAYAELQKRAQPILSQGEQIDNELKRAMGVLKSSTEGKNTGGTRRYSTQDLAKLFTREANRGSLGGWLNPEDEFAEWLNKNYGDESLSVADVSSAAQKWSKKKSKGIGSKDVSRILSDKQLGKLTPRDMKTDIESPEFFAFRRAIDASRRQALDEENIMANENAIRQGALDTVNALGRTPLKDELRSRLSMLAKLGK